MNLDDILKALQARRISPDEAQRLIAEQKSTASAGIHPDADHHTAALATDLSVGQKTSSLMSEATGTEEQRNASQATYTKNTIKKHLISTLARTLYMQESEVGNDKPFIDMGLDSIVGVEWMREINRHYQQDLPATELYDFPTIHSLTDRLYEVVNCSTAMLVDSIVENNTNTAADVKNSYEKKPVAVESTSALSSKTPSGLVLSTVHTIQELSLQPWQLSAPAADELMIQVKASGINFPDIMCVNGLYPTMPEYPFVPGFEVSGIVHAVGSNVAGFTVGDEVIALTGSQMGGHADYVNVPANQVIGKPRNISFAEACSLPVAFGITHYAFALAQLKTDDHVLIQTATGGCGLMALQLAHLQGSTCYGTSSREEKMAILKRLNIPHVMNYKNAFDEEIAAITNNRGVDVVLNMVAGDAIQRGLNALAPQGRYLEIAVHALKTSRKLDLSHLVHNQSIHSIDLRRLCFATGKNGGDTLETMVSLIAEEKIVPIVSRIYPYGQINEALAYVSKGQHIGKVVVCHETSQMIDNTEQCIQGLNEQRQRASLSLRKDGDALFAMNTELTASTVNKPLTNQQISAPRNNNRQCVGESIAVIGMAGQFPQSPDLTTFWENIAAAKDCIEEVPASRWPLDVFYDSDSQTAGKTHCKWVGHLDDADKFDSAFFNISPAEAVTMDPQQRIFLQNCWHCLENAGVDPTAIAGSLCGVFVGCSQGDYSQSMDADDLSSQGMLGGSTSILSSRISFFLNLKGPCLSIDTACSSSLVAIAEACNNLFLGNCEMALAGGVNVLAGPSLHIMTSKAEMLSPDGRCFSFDNQANGFVPGEGVGVLLLKVFSNAMADGDSVQGIIRGWGVNQDGKTNGITAPSTASQVALEKRVYERFHIDPEAITLVEAHGTGTKLGDPIEVNALKQAFTAFTRKENYCALGSVKSNIGHTIAAAGVSGVLKVLLALKHKQLPPTALFTKLNEHITLKGSPFFINENLQDWQTHGDVPRRAVVSSFGFSGTNAHIVIDEAETPTVSRPEKPAQLIVLSARTTEQLKQMVANLLEYTQHNSNLSLGDMSYTLLTGRKHFRYRIALVVDSVRELQESLSEWLLNDSCAKIFSGSLKDSEREEKISLVGYGNQCIEQCTNAIDDSNYIDKLNSIAELYVQAYELNYQQLFTKQYRKVALPAYPFSKRRYWIELKIEDSKEALATTDDEQSFDNKQCPIQVPPPASTELPVIKTPLLTKPSQLALLAAEIKATDSTNLQQEGASLVKPSVQLQDIRLQELAAPYNNLTQPVINNTAVQHNNKSALQTTPYIELNNYGRGVFCISMNDESRQNLMDEQMLKALKTCFDVLNQRQDVKVLLLKGRDKHFSTGDVTEDNIPLQQSLAQLVLQFPLPVMALMQGDSSGLGWFLAACCDFMLVADESHYCYPGSTNSNGVSQQHFDFFAERFGIDFCRRFLLNNNLFSGRELLDNDISMGVQEKALLHSHALQLAYILAEMPQESLRQLKRHFANIISKTVDKIVYPLSARQQTIDGEAAADLQQDAWLSAAADQAADTLNDKDIEQALDNKISVPLQSNVVELHAFKNGVVQITLCDKNNKNMLSRELVEGITEAFNHIADNNDYRAVIITGYEQYFSSGGTKEGLEAIQSGAVKFTDTNIYSIALDCGLPVIAAMQGHGIGAGWSMGMYCDYIIFSEESVYISPYMGYGFTPGAGATLIFPYRLGKDMGREILFTAKEYQGQELKKRGINMPVLPRNQVLAHAYQVACRLATVDKQSLTAFKSKRCQQLREDVNTAYEQELRMHEKTFVGNPDVLQTIQQRFIDDISISQDTDSSVSSAAVASSGTDSDQALLEDITETLRRTLAEQLGMTEDEVEDDLQFMDMGLDSVVGVTWIRKINEAYNLSIAVTKVYQYPTLESFSKYVFSEGQQKGVFAQGGNNKTTESPLTLSSTLTEPDQIVSVPLPTLGPKLVLSDKENQQQEKTVDNSSPEINEQMVTDKDISAGPSFADFIKTDREKSEPEFTKAIAVVGMAGRFPAAVDVNEFWQNIAAGKNCITEIPSSRWSIEEYYDTDPHSINKTYSKWVGALADIDEFDPLFFNISPQEAIAMDPQQRLFLQNCWHCIEDAGYDPFSLSASRCGVFVGCGPSDYGQSDQDNLNAEGLTGSSASILAGRASYFLNLQGPCVAIDTACSSSLVAVAHACDSLLLGNSDLALAGGVCIMVGPGIHIMTSKAGMLSSDGRCYTFDQRANGFVPGEGVGVVLLKRLEDAVKDNDHIDAVIRGWGINQDGKTNGITAPNPESQSRLETEIYTRFNLNPADIQLIETHGTGTKLGDPIEIEALLESFTKYTNQQAYCAVGSVKSNIGHAQAAAGVASLIKVVQALKHKQLPPTINFNQLNEHIELKNTPFYVNTELKDWRVANKQVRSAAVSSFGFSGTNAHVVLTEFEQASHIKQADTPVLIPLSAKSEQQLHQQLHQLKYFLEQHDDQQQLLQQVAYTLQLGRTPMEERLAVVATDLEELLKIISTYLKNNKNTKQCFRGNAKQYKSSNFLFTDSEEMQEAVAKWIKKKRFAPLADMWVKGFSVDWNKLYSGQKPQRISLPTYPFAKERYWIKSATEKQFNNISTEQTRVKKYVAQETVVQEATLFSHLQSKAWLNIEEEWVEEKLGAVSYGLPAEENSILVLCHDDNHYSQIKSTLTQLLGNNSARQYSLEKLNLANVKMADISTVLQRYFREHSNPDTLFYFSSYHKGGMEENHLALQTVFSCCQVLIRQYGQQALQFYHCFVDNNDMDAVYAEGLSGLFRSAMIEYPQHTYRNIAFDTPEKTDPYRSILEEWMADNTGKRVPAQVPMVRYINNTRYITSFNELIKPVKTTANVRFRTDGNYLMVGVLGEVGQLLCQAIAEKYQCTFVILSRRSMDKAVKQKIAAIEEKGATVKYYAVDICQQKELEKIYLKIKSEVGDLHGVMHLARLVEDSPIVNKSLSSFERTISAKVRGTVLLDLITAEEPLEFFVSFSSMGAFGIEGSPDYAYATAFQNAYMRYRCQLFEQDKRSGNSLAICWGQWVVDPYSNAERDKLVKQIGYNFIDVPTALPILEDCLQARHSVLGFMAVNNKEKIRPIYGLSPLVGKEISGKQADGLSETYDKKFTISKNSTLNDNLFAVKTMLANKSHDQLEEIYELLSK